ncbi:GNAT family N-acetyltransferase [Sutcliffiella halmapala]|uniref:GNAT family N-acetyltransferase n=1 Tax=Sutcliffiella halmapala TaxID=79882 RepID=UPI001B8048FF|nr:GNAT family N-acetyltransferase [Sutcliffiella halmapala]
MNNSNLIIRSAGLDDLPAIVSIYNSTVQSRMVTADTQFVTVEDKLAWFHEHNEERRPLWVVEEAETRTVCAWLSFQSFYGRPAYEATAEISIYLHESTRGNGLGAYLLGKSLEACPSLHIENLLGFIFAHNVPSLRLFQKFGFEKWGYLPQVAELEGIKRDLVILGRKINM